MFKDESGFHNLSPNSTKTPTTKNSAITLAASKEFFDDYLLYSGPKPKEMLWSKVLKDVLDKFEILSSPNL
jgi:hypothetical protein